MKARICDKYLVGTEMLSNLLESLQCRDPFDERDYNEKKKKCVVTTVRFLINQLPENLQTKIDGLTEDFPQKMTDWKTSQVCYLLRLLLNQEDKLYQIRRKSSMFPSDHGRTQKNNFNGQATDQLLDDNLLDELPAFTDFTDSPNTSYSDLELKSWINSLKLGFWILI